MLKSLRPSVASAGAIPQPVQDSDDDNVFGDHSEFADQIRYLFRIQVVMMASLVLSGCQLGARTTDPVQLEANRRWVTGPSQELMIANRDLEKVESIGRDGTTPKGASIVSREINVPFIRSAPLGRTPMRSGIAAAKPPPG